MSAKSEVYAVLERNRGVAVSGREIGEQLGISRAAVWKAVEKLREEGCLIRAVTNKGYILDEGTDILSADAVRENLPEKYRDIPIKIFSSVDSTNNAAKAAVFGGLTAEHPERGMIIAANEQTAGRGRYGKSFYSPAHSGLYMSVILLPRTPAADCTLITAAAACAVTDAIKGLCGIETGIKWVNDIYLGGKKVAGILTEAMSDFESGTAEAIIVGIGINISTEQFPSEVNAACSLKAAVSRNALCADIAARLFDSLSRGINDADMLKKYRERSVILGRHVEFIRRGGTAPADKQQGTAAEIDDKGRLVIVTGGKRETSFAAGDISVLY